LSPFGRARSPSLPRATQEHALALPSSPAPGSSPSEVELETPLFFESAGRPLYAVFHAPALERPFRLAGGPASGYRYLVDSNLDWGQDLKGLASWLREQ